MKKLTFEDALKEFGLNYCKRVNYKGRELKIILIQEVRFDRAFYIGYASIYPRHDYFKDSKSFESIHYDKVISRFEKWVDEYCTDWRWDKPEQYKGFNITIKKEQSKENYFGYVRFHKNSIYKHIADTREEVERCCKNRIDRVVYEKEKIQRKMITPKQEKIQELEQLRNRISTQLEKLKKEKDTLTYKGVVLEYGREDGLQEGYMIGSIKNAPEGTQEFYGKSVSSIQMDFEEYIDLLERCANLYNQLMGK